MMRLCEPLGLRALLVIDPKLTAKVSPNWTRRDATKAHAGRPALGPTQLNRVLKPVASETGRRGHLARMASTTPAQRRAIA
jgi:hypothetical protein